MVLDTGITLNEPDAIDVQFSYSQYNGYNVSCMDCFNGNVNTAVTGGTAPYTYLWDDVNNSTTANLSNLNGGEYNLMVYDANGCKTGNTAQLTMPTPKDWSRYGNANIDTTEFIGSTDTSAVVFKSNNQEVLVLSPNLMKVKTTLRLENINEADTIEILRMVGLSNDGTLKAVGSSENSIRTDDQTISYMCNPGGNITPWQHPILYNTTTNTAVGPPLTSEITTCPDLSVGIGIPKIASNVKFHVKGTLKFDNPLFSVIPSTYGRVGIGTAQPSGRFDVRNVNNISAFRVGSDGKIGLGINNNNNFALTIKIDGNVGVGTSNPIEPLHVEGNTILNGNVRIGNDNSTVNDTKLAVEGIIYAREMKVTQGIIWPDYVFKKKYKLRSLTDTEKFISENGHLPEIPAASAIEKNGLNIADMLTLQMKKIEELTLYIIEQQKQMEILKNEVNQLKK
jgi:hypothetical protein